MKRILITAPARQKPEIFDEYRQSVADLIVPDGYEVDTFYVINDCNELIPHMTASDRWIVCDVHDSYVKTHDDHLWTRKNMENVAKLRNLTIRYALMHGYDYWFSTDTDLILHPMTLTQLLADDKDIVSEIFWSTSPNGVNWCNAWMYDQSTGQPQQWKTPGLYQCGMTGALTLVKHRVLEAGVDYTPIPNILNALYGEDRHFCVRAACAGFDMYIDSFYPATHLFTDADFEDYLKSKHGGDTHE